MRLLKFFIYLLFAFAYLYILWHISPLIPFSVIINKSLFSNNSNSAPAVFSHVNPGPDKKWAVSSSYILIYLFIKCSNTCRQ